MKTKKMIKWVCGIAAVIFASLLLLIGSFIYATRYRITDIDAAASPDGKHEIVFQAVGEPDWPFGYSHARIVLKCKGETVTERKFDVANDGGVLHPENWSVRWEENCVKVMISGEEQPDAFYTYYFDGTVRHVLPAVGGLEKPEPMSPEMMFDEPTTDSSDPVAENEKNESDLAKNVQTTGEEKVGIEADMQEIGKLCSADYLQAEKIPSEFSGQEEIRQQDIDAMEAALSSAGYCVENSDAVYPNYLENSEMLNQFWDDVSKERDAEATVWSIASTGSVCCCVFQFADGKGYCIHASGEWDDAGLLRLARVEKREILYWDMTSSGLVYQDIYFDRHWTCAHLLRLQSVDHDLYEWTEKYIAPIGYQNANLFLLDWDSSDFGNVCFNDLLAQMYRMEHGNHFYARDYPYSYQPVYHSIIPADLFESVIYQHFNLSLDEFRERSLYDAENDAYPWQDLNCGNILYDPELIPEVTKVTENANGTVTLLVNVICPDKHTDHLFEHEVTMDIETDGSFRYLSNRIVYRSENQLPSPQPRMEVQRFNVED